MKKQLLFIAMAFLAQLFISNKVDAQELEAWEWSKGVVFNTYSDMTEEVNNAEEFSARSNNIYIYYSVMTFDFDSYEDMGRQLGELAIEMGFSSDSEIDEINTASLPGAYILGKIKGDNAILFLIGNDVKNVAVVGYMEYKTGYKRQALELAKNIYLE